MMPSEPSGVLGTANRKKVQELVDLFAAVGIRWESLTDIPRAMEVAEDADTFAANAILKATRQARHLGRWVLAEDSGLMVDALGGAPGVFSARYSGPNATDQSNNRLLLEKLGSVPLADRTARYVCHMVIADPSGTVRGETEAYCHGRIVLEPRGQQGFGYDPLFEIIEYHRTFGELGLAVKGCLSHRARAARRLIPRMIQLVDTGEWR